MDDERKKQRQNMTGEQKVLLVEFVKKHPKLLQGKFSADFTFKDSQRLWEEVTAILNAVPGANKEWKQWRKTLQDMRSKTKGKKATLKRERSATGGGPQTKVEFKGIAEQIDELITNTEAFGDESIEESATVFVFSNGTMRQSSIYSLLHDDPFEDEIENKDRIEDGNEDIQNVQNKEPNIDEESMVEEGNGKSIIKPVDLPKEGTKENEKEEKNSSNKKKKKLSVPAQRLKKSVTKASKLVDVSRDTYALKKWYYEQKIMYLQRITWAVEKYCGISEEDCPVEFLDEV